MNQFTESPLKHYDLSKSQEQAAIGALVGAAVGDALGAPFEFQEPGLYNSTFPSPIIGEKGEMIGGGHFNWAPGEFTDDTQMALALAESLIESGGFNPAKTFGHFRIWAQTANDIGNTTREALSIDDHTIAAEYAHNQLGRTGSNGAVMRIAPVGVMGVAHGAAWTIKVAREQAALTHFDPIAQWSAVVVAEFIRRLIVTGNAVDSLDGLAEIVPFEHRSAIKDAIDGTTPMLDKNNGGALVCIAQAFWAYRQADSYSEAVQLVINLGGDTDTVAAVTGAMAGARFGVQGIPARWTTYLHGTVSQPNGEDRLYDYGALQDTARLLIGLAPKPESELESHIAPQIVHDIGVWASNMPGAEGSSTDFAVVSLCRPYGRLKNHSIRREYFLLDRDNSNPGLEDVMHDAVHSIEAFLREGRQVLVHCHGGRSRTGFILKAWYMVRYRASHDEAHSWLKSVWPHYMTWTYDFGYLLDDLENEILGNEN